MCGGGGLGDLFKGGGLGGILGSLAGGALDFAFPEVGIPLALATGAGGALGTLAGGGKPLQALETGGISGALAGAGSLLGGGGFFDAPGGSGIAGLFSGSGSDTAAASPGLSTLSTSTGAGPASPISVGSTAPGGGGAGAGAPIAGIASSTGSAPADLTGALPTAGSTITAPAADSGGTGTNLLSRIFGGGTDTTAIDRLGSYTTAISPTGGISDAGISGTPSLLASTAGGTSGTGGGFFSQLGSDLTKPSTLLAGGAALVPLLMGNNVPGLSNLENQAKLMSESATPLAQSLETGNLPPGAAAANAAATQAAKAQVRSQFANLGISGGSQEASALAQVDQNAAAQQYQELLSATQTGLSAINAANPLYNTILSTQLAQDKATQDALARLASALAGGVGHSAA